MLPCQSVQAMSDSLKSGLGNLTSVGSGVHFQPEKAQGAWDAPK